jgi:drug/metabolite transporter (DMT)-like permease
MRVQLSASMRGALWMGVSMVFFTAMTVIIRYLTPAIPAHEQVFVRAVISAATVLPWLLRTGPAGLRTRQMPLMAARAACTGVGILAWIYAVGRMPLAEAVALHFTLPLFGILFAMVLLREKVSAHRWAATAVGFAGALVILRPGAQAVDTVSLVVLGSAMAYALGGITSKVLVRTESPSLIVFYMNLRLVAAFAVPSILYWVPPTTEQWVLLLVFSLTNVLAQLCITRAFAAADASFVMPFEFTRLPLTAVVGFLLFAERPGLWTWAGALVIFGAAYYVTWRERGGGGH